MVIHMPTKKVLTQIDQVAQVPLMVTKMAVEGDTLVYILGKAIVIQSLVHADRVRVINRQSQLVSLCLSGDCETLAVGDDFGKIYVIRNIQALLTPQVGGALPPVRI